MAKRSPGVERALAILDFLSLEPDKTFTLSELARSLSITKSTAHAILSTLTATGYALRNGDLSYSLGPAVIALGEAAMDHNRVIAIARKEIQSLVQEVDVDCVLSTVAGDSILVLAVEHRKDAVPRTIGSRTSNRLPLIPPFGTVFVAWDDKLAERWLSAVDHDLTEIERNLYQVGLLAVRQRGFAVHAWGEARQRTRDLIDRMGMPQYLNDVRRLLEDSLQDLPLHGEYNLISLDSEKSYQLSSIAVPVFSREGRVSLAVTLEFFPETLDVREIERLGTRLLKSAASISSAVGGCAPEIEAVEDDKG
jgi:DNA-binding IclR family transcriptional regulator